MKPALTYYALLVLLLASCFSCKTDSEKKKFVIGVSQCTLEGSWRKSMLLDMKVQASEYPGVSLLVEDAADSSLLQVEQIRSLIKRKVDLLIISANESEPVTPIAIEAYRAGIPTILVDRKISSDEYTTYIGGNNYEIGRQAGFFVNRQVKEKYPTVLEVWGLSGSSPAQDRHRGFMEVLNSRIKVKEIFGKWKPETVEKEIAEMDSLEEVDVVFAHNDVMAMAAAGATKGCIRIGGQDLFCGDRCRFGTGIGAGSRHARRVGRFGLVSDGWEPCYPCSHADIERRRCVPAIFALFCLDR